MEDSRSQLGNFKMKRFKALGSASGIYLLARNMENYLESVIL